MTNQELNYLTLSFVSIQPNVGITWKINWYFAIDNYVFRLEILFYSPITKPQPESLCGISPVWSVSKSRHATDNQVDGTGVS